MKNLQKIVYNKCDFQSIIDTLNNGAQNETFHIGTGKLLNTD